MTPHLVTAMSGPLQDFERRIVDATPRIERWLRMEWQDHTPPFYASVDLRNAGFKLAPVDTNLFPGGFDNLSAQMMPLAVQAAMAAIEKICPEAKNLLLVPSERDDGAGWCDERAIEHRHAARGAAGAVGTAGRAGGYFADGHGNDLQWAPGDRVPGCVRVNAGLGSAAGPPRAPVLPPTLTTRRAKR